MQIKTFKELADALRGTAQHKPSVPPSATPAPERNKVVSIPTRVPINKQAALLVSPIRCWLSQPLPPEKLPDPNQAKLDALKAELKTERNLHSITRDALGAARQKIKTLTSVIESHSETVRRLNLQIDEQKQTIRQLEDLKL